MEEDRDHHSLDKHELSGSVNYLGFYAVCFHGQRFVLRTSLSVICSGLVINLCVNKVL